MLLKRLYFSRRNRPTQGSLRQFKRFKRYYFSRSIRFSKHFKRFRVLKFYRFIRTSDLIPKLRSTKFPFLNKLRTIRRGRTTHHFSNSFKLARHYRSKFVFRTSRRIKSSFFKFSRFIFFKSSKQKASLAVKFYHFKKKSHRGLFFRFTRRSTYKRFKHRRFKLKFKARFISKTPFAYSALIRKKRHFRYRVSNFIGRLRARVANKHRLISVSSGWSPISSYFRARRISKKLQQHRSSLRQSITIAALYPNIWASQKFLNRSQKGLRRLYFAKLTQSYNNFFLQVGNFVSQKIYFTFTAGRVPVLRRNRRKTMQTLVEASTFFSKKLIRMKIKKLQLWVVGPITYFTRKFVKTLKKHRLRVTNVTHFLRYSHNGLRSRALRRV